MPLKGAAPTLDQFVSAAFAGTVAAYDAALIGWKNMIYWNSVRPITAIRHLYNSTTVTSWGGVGKGTVTDLPGIDFVPYIKTAPHTDYPSTSAIYFASFAEAEKAFYGADTFGWSYTYLAGSSAVEPKITPAAAVTITAATFSQYAALGGQARVLGGVHFQEDVDEALRLAAIIGPLSTQYVKNLLGGINSGPLTYHLPSETVPGPYPTSQPVSVTATHKSSSKELGPGPIAGIAIGGVVFMAIVAFGLVQLVALQSGAKSTEPTKVEATSPGSATQDTA